jgi:hypothetical protein
LLGKDEEECEEMSEQYGVGLVSAFAARPVFTQRLLESTCTRLLVISSASLDTLESFSKELPVLAFFLLLSVTTVFIFIVFSSLLFKFNATL